MSARTKSVFKSTQTAVDNCYFQVSLVTLKLGQGTELSLLMFEQIVHTIFGMKQVTVVCSYRGDGQRLCCCRTSTERESEGSREANRHFYIFVHVSAAIKGSGAVVILQQKDEMHFLNFSPVTV